jgi:hypothetical protein
MENRESGGPSTNTPFEATKTSGLTVAPPLSSKAIGYDKKQERLKALQALPKDHRSKRKIALDTFMAAPRESQRKVVEDKWAELCYELVNKAMIYQKNVTDKDFGKLTQLIISAATAKDKVFHREDATQKSGNVVFNLFGNVGLDAIKRMLQPPAPVVINPKELTNEVTDVDNNRTITERV